MYIDQMSLDSIVTLQVQDGPKKINLVSTIRYCQDQSDDNVPYKYCFVEPFMHDGKILKFDKGHYTLLVDNTEDHMQYRYNIQSIKAIKYNDIIYHMLVSSDDAKFINRRETIRVPLGVSASISNHSHNFQGYIRDISVSGMALIIDESFCPNIGDMLRCKFDKFYQTYTVCGKVVRCAKDERSNKYIVGCHFPSNYKSINELVNEIQLYNRKNYKK